MDRKLALSQLQRFCVLRDRCHSEVRGKLLDLKIYGDDLEEIIAALIADSFLNEERYARSFVRGKFYQNHWGRNKIRQVLFQKQVPEKIIEKAMGEIQGEDYRNMAATLAEKKWSLVNDVESIREKRDKVCRYLLGKGFEFELSREITEALKDTDPVT